MLYTLLELKIVSTIGGSKFYDFLDLEICGKLYTDR